MASFKGVTQSFRLTLINSEGDSERVSIELSLDGMKVQNREGTRTMRSYALKDITRWQSCDDNLVIYTRTPVDLEERQTTLTGDRVTIRTALDTLTCCCMQLAEILANTEQEASSNLQSLVAGGGRSKRASPSLPTADQVEYWQGAEKQGWLQSQGDVTKIWRRRWFVLKQGYLFRFMSSDVSESTKPRGVVDLSQVQDVRDGRAATGKGNSIQLKTAQGGSSVCYVCDNETELVEWISALEGAVAKVVKTLAGVDDEAEEQHAAAAAAPRGGVSSSSSRAEWARQLERAVEGSSTSSARGGGAMVSVLGYEGGGGARGGADKASRRTGAPGLDAGGGGISSYSQIVGFAGLAGGSGLLDDAALNYGVYGSGRPGGGASGGHEHGEYAAGVSGRHGNGWGGAHGDGCVANSGDGSGGAYGGAHAAAAQQYGAPPRGFGNDSYAAAYAPYNGRGYEAAAAAAASAPEATYSGGHSGGAYGAAGYGSQGYQGSYGAAALHAPGPAYGGPMDANGSVGADAGSFSAGAGSFSAGAGSFSAGAGSFSAGVGSFSAGAVAGGFSAGVSSFSAGAPAGGYAAQAHHAQGGAGISSTAVTSLIDQVPHQQPTYPHYQHIPAPEGTASAAMQPPPSDATVPTAPPSASAGSWQMHYAPDGRVYYHHSTTGATQWDTPPGL